MKFTYYTIIGKDPDMLSGHISNIRAHAGFDRLRRDKEFIVIIYSNNKINKGTTSHLVDICKANGVRPVIYQEPTSNWLDNLYACWNLGYSESSEGWVFRSGSDQVHNYDALINLYNAAMSERERNPHIIINANTIEHSVRAMSHGNVSRHIIANFGDSFQVLKIQDFEEFVAKLNAGVNEKLLTVQDSIRYWGKPTQFSSTISKTHNRTEGCSWLITKDDWRRFGPMPPTREGITGDCWLHDQLEKAGYKDYLARDCVTYHFFRGESYHRFAK